MSSNLQAGLLSLSVVTIVLLLRALVRRRYYHPLAKFPGPLLPAISNLPHAYHTLCGDLYPWVGDLHERYGEVVRIRPDELSFITPSAWKDIFSHRPQYPKHITMPEVGVASIATANDMDHARHRKLLAHAFSEKALRDQEPILQYYTDLLISKLSERSTSGDPVDLTEWYNFISFDIVADLSFGEPFHNLEKQENHPWVTAVEADMKMAVQLSQSYAIPSLSTIVNFLLPLYLGSNHHLSYQFSQIKTTERLNSGSARADFMTHILRHNDEKGLSRPEIDADVSTLINAGSETTSTALSGCTYFLLKNINELQRLKDEIRGTFKTSGEITSAALANLPYLTAVLEETLRLYPPLPVALPRLVSEDGGEIAGYKVPVGTVVGIPQRVANHSPTNFTDPLSFKPARWLKDGEPKHEYEKDRRDVFQPFHAGPRNCLGRHLADIELRIIMAKMIWNFDMELADPGVDWTDQKIWLVYEKLPLLVRLRPRKVVDVGLS